MSAASRKTSSFARKALTDAQRGYVAIELELLAVAWAMEKFHHFLHASHHKARSQKMNILVYILVILLCNKKCNSRTI